MIAEKNDGSMPREPYQRCSQALFEAWLKPICEANPLIESHFGVKAEEVKEGGEGTTTSLLNMTSGERKIVHSKYVVACDGAGSRLRKSIEIPLTGGPV
jgi:2-polyprenyl-6-methoxyphenol hydroxylase-like FAD-dependent oxidoreductase